MILNILAIVFGILGTYYGCRQGFKAWQWEHRCLEAQKQIKEILDNNAGWSRLYESCHANYLEAMRELSLLRTGEMADKQRITQLERTLRREWVEPALIDAGDTEGGSHD